MLPDLCRFLRKTILVLVASLCMHACSSSESDHSRSSSTDGNSLAKALLELTAASSEDSITAKQLSEALNHYSDSSFLLMSAGEIDSAVCLMEAILTVDTLDLYSLNNLGVLAAVQGNYDSAMTLISLALAVSEGVAVGSTICQTAIGDRGKGILLSGFHRPEAPIAVDESFWDFSNRNMFLQLGEFYHVPLDFMQLQYWGSYAISENYVSSTPAPEAVVTFSDGTKDTLYGWDFEKSRGLLSHQELPDRPGIYLAKPEIERNIEHLEFFLKMGIGI